ncbi:hypothetical protein DY000_02002797 [Brassica cretica]|uniref:Uncharacterized protein n=1 Tax=Brassica cretica TaxID=69181 RepID=A0ABQ7C172_BRACR|nr:hypothetical protein DY000_02002797 [Brassica cretica]
MASLVQMGSPLIYSKALAKTTQRPQPFTCTIVAKTTPGSESPSNPRRSANYRPSLWDHHHLLSVENTYTTVLKPSKIHHAQTGSAPGTAGSETETPQTKPNPSRKEKEKTTEMNREAEKEKETHLHSFQNIKSVREREIC